MTTELKYDTRKLHDIKMKKRYGVKKKTRMDEAFRKTMHQRKKMKKQIEVKEGQKTLLNFTK